MNKLLASVVIAATVAMAGTAANAGGINLRDSAWALERAVTKKKVEAGGRWGYFADKPFMGCIRNAADHSRLAGRLGGSEKKVYDADTRRCRIRYGYEQDPGIPY